jgi:hypothetical protein
MAAPTEVAVGTNTPALAGVYHPPRLVGQLCKVRGRKDRYGGADMKCPESKKRMYLVAYDYPDGNLDIAWGEDEVNWVRMLTKKQAERKLAAMPCQGGAIFKVTKIEEDEP